MPYTVRNTLKKIALGAVLIALAASLSLLIKEALDIKNPESAVPDLTVSVDGMILSPSMIFRAGYEWNFWATVDRNTPFYTPHDITTQVYPVDIAPRSIINLKFSIPHKSLHVSRADNPPEFSQYIQLQDKNPTSIISPATPGQYMYKVEAGFGWRGSVIYYMMFNVKEAP